MAHIRADAVQEQTVASGTGTITLGGATDRMRAFSAVMSVGDTCYCRVEGIGTNQAENFVATMTSGGLTRGAILFTTDAGGGHVNFAAGQKIVTLVNAAANALEADADGWFRGNPSFAGTVHTVYQHVDNAISIGGATGQGAVILTGPTGGQSGLIEIRNASGTRTGYLGWDVAQLDLVSDGSYPLALVGGGGIVLQTNGANNVIVAPSGGHVVIGSNSPGTVPLDAGGSTATQLGALANMVAFLGAAGPGFGGVYVGAGVNANTPSVAASHDGSGNPLPLVFYTADAERMRISASGSITYSGSVAFNGGLAAPLTITDNSARLGQLIISNAGGTGANIQLDDASGVHVFLRNSGGNFQFVNSPYTAVPFQVDQGGDVVATGSLTTNGSIVAGQSITVGTGGIWQPGAIYSDGNWGMLFRAHTASPADSVTGFADQSGSILARIKAGGALLLGGVVTADAVPGTNYVEAPGGIWSVAASGGQGSMGVYDKTPGHFGGYLASNAGYCAVPVIDNAGNFAGEALRLLSWGAQAPGYFDSLAGPGAPAIGWMGDAVGARWLTSLGGYKLTFSNDYATAPLDSNTVSHNGETFYSRVEFAQDGTVSAVNFNATGTVNINGNINLAGNLFGHFYYSYGYPLAASNSSYAQFYDPSGAPNIYLGGGTDRNNYYRNSGHQFQGPGGTGPTALWVQTGADHGVVIAQDAGHATYNCISLNGDTGEAACAGFIGGGGTDANLYYNVPTGYHHEFRVNGTPVFAVNGGNVSPFSDNAMSLGLGGNRWSDVRAASAHITGSDIPTVAVFSGATKGLRIGFNGSASIIEGVDASGVASYQPLNINATALTFTCPGAQAVSLIPNYFYPTSDANVSLGAPANRWNGIWSTTAAPGTNDSTVATTAFVQAAVAAGPNAALAAVGGVIFSLAGAIVKAWGIVASVSHVATGKYQINFNKSYGTANDYLVQAMPNALNGELVYGIEARAVNSVTVGSLNTAGVSPGVPAYQDYDTQVVIFA